MQPADGREQVRTERHVRAAALPRLAGRGERADLGGVVGLRLLEGRQVGPLHVLHDGEHQPIIDAALFAKAQAFERAEHPLLGFAVGTIEPSGASCVRNACINGRTVAHWYASFERSRLMSAEWTATVKVG